MITIAELQLQLIEKEGHREAKHPELKQKARTKLVSAISSRVLDRKYECEVCGAKETGEFRKTKNGYHTRVLIFAHHWNYALPLDVIFVCAACHWHIHHGHTELHLILV